MLNILFWAVAIIAMVFLGLRLCLKSTTRNRSYVCLIGKTAIVTGSNTGIGYYTALDLASRGARVILACRTKSKADSARDRIIEATNNKNVVTKLVDFQSLQSIRSFCKDINENEERLDILVNNAGTFGMGDRYTEDELQITMQTNHFSPFLLTHLLINKLKQSAPSRVVNVASSMANYGKLRISDINKYPKGINVWSSEFKLYNNTKQANVLFTRELAMRLEDSGVTTNALDPGAVITDIWRRLPPKVKRITDYIMNFVFKDSEEGAQTTIYAAVSKDLKDVTGRLFKECKQLQMYESCRSRVVAKELWEESEKYVKLTDEEKI